MLTEHFTEVQDDLVSDDLAQQVFAFGVDNEHAMQITLATHGRIDGCFANAGIGGRGTRFDETTDEEWQRILAVNLDGVFYTFKHAARHMRERAERGDLGGRLIGTSFAWLTTTLAATSNPADAPAKLAYTAAAVGFSVYFLGLVLSFWLPEPKEELLD